MADTLPEGTDHIIPGAQNASRGDAPEETTASETQQDRSSETQDAASSGVRDQVSAKAAELKGQAADKARAYADEGKGRAADGLDSVARMISDSAAQIDGALGGTYGDYARKAGDAVAGFSSSIRDKQVEELLDDARALVRRSPAIAIGAAAAAGFMLARVLKAGSEALSEAAETAEADAARKPGKKRSDG